MTKLTGYLDEWEKQITVLKEKSREARYRRTWLDGHAAATVTYKKKYAKVINCVTANLNAYDARKQGYDEGYLKGYAAAVQQYRHVIVCCCVKTKDAAS